MSKKLINKSKSTIRTGASAQLEHLENIFKLMGKHSIGELEVEDDSGRIHVRVAGTNSPSVSSVATLPIVPSVVSSPTPSSSEALSANQKKVLSPFVGTFYRSPNPTAEYYVKEGQTIRKGQTLCIVEAMKLMNEIESELNGKIVSVLVENGQPVEFGEPLFIVEV